MKKQKVYVVMHEISMVDDEMCRGTFIEGIYSSAKKAQSEIDALFDFVSKSNKKLIEQEDFVLRYQSLDPAGDWWQHEYRVNVREVR